MMLVITAAQLHVLLTTNAMHTQAVLSMEGIDTSDFSPEVLACLPQGDWHIVAEQVKLRQDFRNLRYAIDRSMLLP